MQNLSGTVGENGANARHDTALVQAILVLTQRPAALDPGRARYLTVIDGDCGDRTKRSIRQFQDDQVLAKAGDKFPKPTPGVKPGLVSPDDFTWKKLVAAVPAALQDLRVLKGSKTVFVAATRADCKARTTAVDQLTFQQSFRAAVTSLIDRIYDRHGIAIGVCDKGDRRTFKTQYELLTSGRRVTNAGPGESNHNFGQAVDLGFAGLRWLGRDGVVVENETSWLHRLDPDQKQTPEALVFWNLLRTEGTQAGLYRGPVNDRPHLQAWSDSSIDMADRLADHLTRSGRMRWTGRSQRYQCDLGFGGAFFNVGSAAQIWSRQATVTAEMLTPRAEVTAPAATPHRTAAVPVTPQDIDAMRARLRAEFEAADTNWQAWRAR